MDLVGIAALLVSLVLATWSTLLLSRANPDVPLRWWGLRLPPNVPRRARWLNAIAGSAVSLGVVLLADKLGHWTFPAIFGVVGATIVVQLMHNSALNRQHDAEHGTGSNGATGANIPSGR